MKKVLNNKLFLVLITAIICISTTAYATLSYSASQITYTKSNNQEVTLDAALDELYTDALELNTYKSKYDSITVKLETASSSRNQANGRLACVDLVNQYKKFKVIELTNNGGSECVVKGYASILSSNNWITLSLNQEYDNYSSTDGYRFSTILVNLRATTEGTSASCRAKIQFYN